MQKRFHLSEAEQKFFYENGYAGPFTLYEPEEMTRVWEDVRMDLLDVTKAAFPNSKLNYDRHLDMPALNQIISHPKIVDRISSILGPNVLSWRTEWFPKYPGDEGTDWHQAESFVEFEGTEKLEPTAAEEGRPWELTAWVAMSEATKENGCLKLMPGSHRTWYFDEKRNIPFEPENFNKRVLDDGQKSGFYGYDYEKLKLDPSWKPDEARAVHMEVKPGQFFIFTSRCMHGSNPNTSKDSVRFGWATRFVPTHVKVYSGQDAFHHFGEVLPLDRYSTVLVAGEDRYGHNRVTKPLAAAAALA
ncbi:chlorinating enzyme [Burkholderia oklahomensis]|uniref:CytC3 n=1 Tax=Burkholderia oklahomensis TaxID=342113 RepID=A0AAI8BEB1_9BURK|nr:chlorinating enzyme [Burkholderia oklahomensis]AIO70540.1 cytC3 [Burkholderia oklahomensis]AJX35947.1 cytC3 [Burkholderia oklahomensis C6786]AOI38611.1 peptide synthase [Burkholderia oklahomensis EO147]AOI48327.1 peptide synthase [Burkholderia oklahomensis C6786]KUY48266.1 peptide synthase [Burkholderia oklahomensis EO147]